MRLVLASASPARLRTLRAAGLRPQVLVSAVDEDAVAATHGPLGPARTAGLLAQAKADDVAARIDASGEPTLVVGCDSVLELDGHALGKPVDAADAARRWRAMRGRSGVLHTGHGVRLLDRDRPVRRADAVASTVVTFAEVSDAEVEAYVATGEPLAVAGAFTLDGLGGAFVRGIEGDPHTVVGIGLPLLRDLLNDLGVAWTDLWSTGQEPDSQAAR